MIAEKSFIPSPDSLPFSENPSRGLCVRQPFCAARLVTRATQETLKIACHATDGDENWKLKRSPGSRRKHVRGPARVVPSRGDASTQQKKRYRSKRSCSLLAQSRPPLTRDEEHQFFADVQDLLHLENIKEKLKEELQRVPTDQEWADSVGCSICRLYARIGKGRAAKRKMIAANLPLVASVAKQFHGRGLSHQELCQEGVLGLLKSTEKFDISHDTKFSTYSFFWIRQRMSTAANKFQRIWMVAKSIHKTVSFVLQCKDKFREVHGRNPSMDELALVSKIDKTKIRQAFSAIRPTKSLSPSQMSTNQDHKSYVEPEDPKSGILPWSGLWEKELKKELGILLLALSPRELQVLTMRYGIYGGTPLSLVQIAANLDVSHERVRMAEKSALSKLRRSAEVCGLKQYLSTIGRSSIS